MTVNHGVSGSSPEGGAEKDVKCGCGKQSHFFILISRKIMLLFKTSGDTLTNVVHYQKHAFGKEPKDNYRTELILVSKNKNDCKKGEAQIQYVMRLDAIRNATHEEIERYWLGYGTRWGNGIIVDCTDTITLPTPFNLSAIIGPEGSERYRPIQQFGKIDNQHELLIIQHLRAMGVL